MDSSGGGLKNVEEGGRELEECPSLWLEFQKSTEVADGRFMVPVYSDETREKVILEVEMHVSSEEERRGFRIKGVAILLA